MSAYPDELLELVEKILDQEQQDRERASERFLEEVLEHDLVDDVVASWVQGAMEHIARRRGHGKRGPSLRVRDSAREPIAPVAPPDLSGLVALAEQNLLETQIDGKRLGDMRKRDLAKLRRARQETTRWLLEIEKRMPDGIRVRDQFDHLELADLLQRAKDFFE